MKDIALLLNKEFPKSKIPTIEMPSLFYMFSSNFLKNIAAFTTYSLLPW
jgi:hypothetical protein